MRLIRFRAWHKENKDMVYFKPWDLVSDQYQAGHLVTLMAKKSEHLMQYTGLKDKNCKEIFEGDVIKYNVSLDGKIKDIAVVKYLAEGLNPKAMFGIMVNGLHELSGIEIIGNVYESPGLLKQEVKA